MLFDQPHVVAGASDVLRAAGVADRVRVVGGSFFDAVPTGGDAYVLKMRRARLGGRAGDGDPARLPARMPADGALLVVERVVGAAERGPDAKFSDLNMLVAPGGRERTLDELSGASSATPASSSCARSATAEAASASSRALRAD